MDESATGATGASATSQKKQKMGPKSGLIGHHGASAVWNYFHKHFIEGTKKYFGKVECKYCHKIIESPSSGGTNKLWNHIKVCKECPDFQKDATQPLISFSRGQPSNWIFNQERCRKALGEMIILDELSFSIVERQGFRLFCGEMQPRFHVVCRTTIAKDCIKIFYEEKRKLKEYLNELSPRVSITIDMWTSIQNLGYMVVTAHFVDKDWKLQKRIINFCVIPHPHKGEVIAKALESCLIEWNFNKIMTITLDNAKNNDTCMVDLRRRLIKNGGLLLEGDYFHVRCFAHVINLVVRDGINQVKETIKRLRRSVKYVRSSPSRMQAFKKCVSIEKLTSKKIVCIDVKTRWNSTYLMIHVAMEFEMAFERLKEEDPNYKYECNVDGLLGVDDWKKLKALHVFLEDFYELTTRVSGSKYVTSNTYFDEIIEVKETLRGHLNGDDVALYGMAKKMDEKFEKYCNFDSLNLILVVAIVLDPRYKVEYVEFWYTSYLKKCSYIDDDKELDAENKQKVKDFVKRLKDLMDQLYAHYMLESPGVESSNTQDVLAKSLENVSKRPKAKDLFKNNLKRKDFGENSNELDRYLKEVVVDEEGSFDILAWWHDRVHNYRALAIMARDILSIPVTSVASECAFSTAGRVLDPFRSSLTPRIVECLVCTQDWLRNPMALVSVEEKLENLEEIEQAVLDELSALELGNNN